MLADPAEAAIASASAPTPSWIVAPDGTNAATFCATARSAAVAGRAGESASAPEEVTEAVTRDRCRRRDEDVRGMFALTSIRTTRACSAATAA